MASIEVLGVDLCQYFDSTCESRGAFSASLVVCRPLHMSVVFLNHVASSWSTCLCHPCGPDNLGVPSPWKLCRHSRQCLAVQTIPNSFGGVYLVALFMHLLQAPDPHVFIFSPVYICAPC